MTLSQKQIRNEKKEIEYYTKFSKKYELTKKYNTHTFVAYNSGKYDHFLLLKEKVAKDAITNILNSQGILTMTLWGNIEFKDLIRHTSVALGKLCKTYGLPKEYCKSSFPHSFVNKETLNYVGPLPEAEYWPDNEIPEDVIEK